MKLNEHALSAYPLLKAIAAIGDQPGTQAELAKAAGRSAKNLPRDLDKLAEAGWITREPGSPLALTDAGRDVIARIAAANADAPQPPAAEAAPDVAAVELPLHLIDENPDNPRTAVDAEADAELTASIGARGVLQPIMVRAHKTERGRYVVVMGSRRRRCSIAAGKLTIAAVIRQLDDAAAFEAATIENVQRDDMNAMDQARAYRRLIDDRMKADRKLSLKAAKEDVARIVGKSARLIELRLEFLEKLPPVKQAELQARKITAKEATAWLREQPEPLSPRARLALGEIVDAYKSREKPPACWFDAVEIRAKTVRTDKADHTKVDVKVDDAGVIAELRKRQLVEQPQELRELSVDLGRHILRLAYSFYFDKRAGDEIAGILDEKKRPKLLAELRKAAGLAKPNAGEYSTAWLNGPFETAPEIEAELTAKRQVREQENAAADARQEEAQREHVERVQAAHDRFARVGEGEARLAALKMDDTAAIVAGLAADCDVRLPLFVSIEGVIVDAAGREVVERSLYNQNPLFKRPALRMIVAIVNAAAGLTMPLHMPGTVEPAAVLPRAEFVRVIAGCLLDDCDDLPEDEAEAEFVANERASRGLEAMLDQAGVEYGDPEYDWEETGAMAIAQGIRVDGLGQASTDAEGDVEAGGGEGEGHAESAAAEPGPAAEAETPDFLKRLAGVPTEEARP